MKGKYKKPILWVILVTKNTQVIWSKWILETSTRNSSRFIYAAVCVIAHSFLSLSSVPL